MLKIGDLSRLAQVSVKTLRYYSDLGLLKPEWIDRYTGYRYYAPEQLARLNRILALRDLGLSLEQIRGLLDESVAADELRGMLRLRRAELERSLSQERARLTRVEARLRQIDREGREMDYPVVIKSIEAQRVVAVSGTVEGYGQTGALLTRLKQSLSDPVAQSAASGPLMALYCQRADRALEAEVGLPLTAGARPRALAPGLSLINRAASPQAAATLHHGDPAGIAEAYAALLRWVSEGGYHPSGLGMEVYIHGPLDGLVPEEWMTEIRMPIVDTTASLTVEEKEQLMNPEIKSLPGFVVIGQLYRGKNEHGEIPAMWDDLNARWGALEAIRGSGAAYGVCSNMEPDGVFEYIAGVEVPGDAPLPEGMSRWEVPPQTYAVFPCTLATLHQAYEQAYQVWLPGSGYKRIDGPDFELYPETFEPDDPESQGMFIHVPIGR
jgi:predicted transcriptional regulator YdeE/DNA-binding transcriptional MerR regulator